ncbi:MAG TPA: N-formylglutamate deformylase [Aliidongia sp.]|uniref:N-formylglutamate deformylase n=1 Tax=Aliidongia sp. TaxID=1914230 RepID=UPI002DDD36A8|nr:N-formylglutamate deformylase [Aliidongia sp.]HEV2675971.1 N-formylglutamate deformylase [Aliidongia sp.]
MTEIHRFTQGSVPVLVSMPHIGTALMPGLADRLSDAALPLGDTDWHLPRLYDFLDELGCSRLEACHSRFVVDLNRPPDDAPLYAGATTGLIPDILFDGTPAYRPGAGPDAAERAQRLETYWRPYHAKLEAELDRLVATHGGAVLLDAHSIRGIVPRLFEGRLPDFNIGTADGKSCAPDLARRVLDILGAAPGYTAILNGRFKGGHITRHYGDPSRGRHAVQLELVQATYMDETAPYAFRPDLAAGVRPHLRRFVEMLVAWAQG